MSIHSAGPGSRAHSFHSAAAPIHSGAICMHSTSDDSTNSPGGGKLRLPYRSLADMFTHVCSAWADRPMLEGMGVSLTYGEIDRMAAAFSSYLINVLGMRKGDRIAMVMPNIIQMPVAIIASLRAGLTVVNVNPQYTSREMHYQLLDAEVTAVVILENFAGRLAEIMDYTLVRHVVVARIGDMRGRASAFFLNKINYLVHRTGEGLRNLRTFRTFRQALKLGQSSPADMVHPDSGDIAFLQYTGGTTGIPKGAILTHANLLSNIEQTLLEYGSILEEGRERIMSALPLYHVFALTINFLLIARIGGCSCLIVDPRKIPALVRSIRSFRPTVITGVNTLFNALTFSPDFPSIDFSTLKLVVGGGCAVQKAVAERWQKITGTFILEGYGMTECSPLVCVGPADQKIYTGNIGRPVSYTEVRIVDPEGKEITAMNEPGELWIRGPQVCRGYWYRDADTRGSFTDGWFHSGDIGVWRENRFIRLVDRKKDMILVSGFNVYPNEIEEVIATNSKVVEAAAIGVRDPGSGERVKVFVVRKDPSLTSQELTEFCQKYLAHYKIPKYVEFVDSLPKSNVGKILRNRLREMEREKEREKDRRNINA